MNIMLFLHVAGVVIWVGGMFFAYIVLRPASAEILEAPERLPLWGSVLRRFFSWVWVAAAVLLVSGLGMILRLGGFASVGWYVHAMLALGLAMMAIFAHVFFAPYGRLRRYVAAREWQAAGAALGQIRLLVGLNLALGIVVVAIATLGRIGL
jgi:uncharacterized membrane protein